MQLLCAVGDASFHLVCALLSPLGLLPRLVHVFFGRVESLLLDEVFLLVAQFFLQFFIRGGAPICQGLNHIDELLR